MIILISIRQDEDGLGPWTLNALGAHRNFPADLEADNPIEALRALANALEALERRWEGIPD